MNPYDKAHELAKALSKDSLINEYRLIKEQILENKELNSKLESFKEKRTELQINTLQTGEINKEAEEEVKKLYQELLTESLTVQYFEKEVKINVLISDIQKIIYEDIKDLL